MIRKIILENYMSHVRTVIEPAAGLTVLIGPNNCGKSAVAHALEMICYNSDAAVFAIRHGEKKATVTIELEDEAGNQHTIIWWRTKQTAGYIIDGREISGMGKGKIPDDLHRFLKMPEIRPAGAEPFRIHFGLQKKPIFLLDDPPSRAAQFFASSSDADRLMEMQKRHKQKEANAKRDREKLDQEILKLDQQLAELAPLEELSGETARLEARHSQIMENQSKVFALSKCIDVLDRAAKVERALAERVHSLAGLQSPPAQQLIEPLRNEIGAISAAMRRARTNQAMFLVLADLKMTPLLRETAGLSLLVTDLMEASRRFDREADRVRATQPLRPVPSQDDPANLKMQIAAMEKAQGKRIQLEASYHRLENLPEPPREAQTRPLRDLVGEMEKSAALVTDARKFLKRSEQKREDLRQQIELWVQENPRCENCGQSIDAELILTGGHAHE